jgi:hypothetical protein
MDKEQERLVELYAHLCNWHWFATHPDEPLTEVMHTSPESRAFANKVLEFMEAQIKE